MIRIFSIKKIIVVAVALGTVSIFATTVSSNNKLKTNNSKLTKTIADKEVFHKKKETLLLEEIETKKQENDTIITEKNTITEEKIVLEEENKQLKIKLESEKKSREAKAKITSSGGESSSTQAVRQASAPSGKDLGTFISTAYDLSYASCGKNPGDSYYGITASGVNLGGKSRGQAMAVAVDPRIIPLGSKLHIQYPAPYKSYSGIYTAVDTGGAIKGRIIDTFMGSGNVSSEVRQFGRRQVKIRLI